MRAAIANFIQSLIDGCLFAASFCFLVPAITVFSLWRKKSGLQSLWGTTPILTLPVLAKAERMLGIRSVTFVKDLYYINDEFDYILSRKWPRRPIRLLVPYLTFGWACRRFDRFHFFLDRGLLPNLTPGFNRAELLVYQLLRKEVFFYTYGADVRTKLKTSTLGTYHLCMDCPSIGKFCICDDKKGRSNTRFCMAHSTAVFSMGDMNEYTPGSRKDLFFWPIDLDAENKTKFTPHFPARNKKNNFLIVHAPNNRFFKGTKFLIQAVKQLQDEAIDVELLLVEKIPNVKALEIYKRADLIFDQCIAGFHGYLALEAMALGKPVMCYIRKPDNYLLHPEACPIINVLPGQITAALRHLFKNPEALHDLGVKGRHYIETYFSLAAFARRLDNAYKDLGCAQPENLSGEKS